MVIIPIGIEISGTAVKFDHIGRVSTAMISLWSFHHLINWRPIHPPSRLPRYSFLLRFHYFNYPENSVKLTDPRGEWILDRHMFLPILVLPVFSTTFFEVRSHLSCALKTFRTNHWPLSSFANPYTQYPRIYSCGDLYFFLELPELVRDPTSWPLFSIRFAWEISQSPRPGQPSPATIHPMSRPRPPKHNRCLDFQSLEERQRESVTSVP